MDFRINIINNTIIIANNIASLCLAVAFIVVGGCERKSPVAEALFQCKQLSSSNPDSARAILNNLSQSVGTMTRDERMHYELYSGVAKIRSYKLLGGDSMAMVVANYFKSDGTQNEKMMAQYVLGHAYLELGDVPMALQSFHTAVESVDTTRADCDYYTMVSIYGLLANIFYRQALPEEEIKANKMFGYYAGKMNDTLSVIKSKELLTRPYFLLKDTDKVLSISDTARALYTRYGYEREAAEVLISPIRIYLERGEFNKAKEYLDIYEHKSGLFDANCEIKSGREIYYRSKGRYMEGVGEVDSAIYYYHKAEQYGLRESAYKGLLNAYEKKNQADSIAKYAKLFADAKDSAWFAKNSEMVERVTAMYNYGRHKQLAEENAQRAARAEKERFWLFASLVAVVLMCVYVFSRIRSKHKREVIEQQEIEEAMQQKFIGMQKALVNAEKDIKLQRYEYEEKMRTMRQAETDLNSEIQTLKDTNKWLEEDNTEKTQALLKLREERENETRAFNNATDARNYEIKKMKEEISMLAKELFIDYSMWELDFFKTKVYLHFKEIAEKRFPSEEVTEGEWETFIKAVRSFFPAFYKYVTISHPLKSDQLKVCLLVWAGFSEGDIATLMSTDNKRVTRIKAQINRKLFSADDASSLRLNLKEYR